MAVLVLRAALGPTAIVSLSGCVSDKPPGPEVAALPTGATPASTPPPVDGEGGALMAKARALVAGGATSARYDPSIDLAMLSTRANPDATHRLDGPTIPGKPSQPMPPEEVLARLRDLSQAYRQTSGRDDASAETLDRLRELSRQTRGLPPPPDESALARSPPVVATKPVSPEAIMRRMQELSAPASAANAGPAPAAKVVAAEAFGGLGAFVPAPDAPRAPGSDRVRSDGAGAAR